MIPPTPRTLVPPRPNLGPEPWSEPTPIEWYIGLGVLLAILLGGSLVWRRRARNRARRAARSLAARSAPPDTSPRGRLVALSHSIRDTLANQFGTAWRAKTNEELAAEPRLRESLGNERLEELIQFLVAIDHLKFAPNRSNPRETSLEEQLAAWEPRLAELGKQIRARPERRPKNGSVRRTPAISPPVVNSAPRGAKVLGK